MTYNYKDTAKPMSRIQKVLEQEYYEKGRGLQELAKDCSTTPATISKWIKYGPDLKWYSLMDICVGLEVPIATIFADTRWETLFRGN